MDIPFNLSGLQTSLPPPNLRLRTDDLVLSTGANHNVDSGLANHLRISGPSSSFSISGFSGSPPSKLLVLQNDMAQTMTLSNLNSGSLAQNQIITRVGRDLALPGPSYAQLIYDDRLSKWLVLDSYAQSRGTSFPSSPQTGDRFFRTDLGFDCFWDGTRWLTCHEYSVDVGDRVEGGGYTVGSATLLAYARIRTDFTAYVTRAAIRTLVDTTNDGTRYYDVGIAAWDIGGTLGSYSVLSSFDTSTDTPSVWTSHDVTVNSSVGATNAILGALVTAKTGSPGALRAAATIYYRLIVT